MCVDVRAPQVNTSQKACARPYPACEHQGILWVWPQPQTAASLELSEATPLPSVPAIDDPAFSFNMGQQDLGYGYGMMQYCTALHCPEL